MSKSQQRLNLFEERMVRARLGRQTIKTYLGYARDYVEFCKGKAFSDSKEAVAEYLSSFPKRNLAVSTQRAALNALVGQNGLYTLLGKPVGKLPDWVKAKKPQTVPAWVTQSETERICDHLTEPWSLMIRLMFGSGLRVSELVSLRLRDLDFERGTITVKQSKGKKDRITFLPKSLVDELRAREKKCRAMWNHDREKQRPGVEVPTAISNKSPKVGEQWPFFWVFPAAGESTCPTTKIRRRHHIHQKSLAKPVRIAAARAGISKRVTAHAFRHGFATAYLMNGGVITELRDLMGHKSIETTEIYTHCLPSFTDRVGSPLDRTNVVPFIPNQTQQPTTIEKIK